MSFAGSFTSAFLAVVRKPLEAKLGGAPGRSIRSDDLRSFVRSSRSPFYSSACHHAVARAHHQGETCADWQAFRRRRHHSMALVQTSSRPERSPLGSASA